MAVTFQHRTPRIFDTSVYPLGLVWPPTIAGSEGVAARRRGGILQQPPQDRDRLGQHLMVGGLEPGQLRFDRGGPVSAHRVERLHALLGDADADRPRIAGVDGSRHQSGILEPAHLGRHRRLRTVVDGRQVADARFALGFDRGQQPGLRRWQRHLDPLGR